MPANNVTNTVVLQLLSTEDSTQNVLVNRAASSSLDVVLSSGLYYASTPDNLGHGFEIPFWMANETINQFYVRNTNPTGSILITGQPVGGGASANLALLGPGDVFIFWQDSTGSPPVSGMTQGLNANPVYQGSAANITFEWFVGG